MSQVQIENQQNLDQELQEDKESSVYTSEVSITTESEEVPVEKLQDMPNKNKFLTKVGFYFLFHSFFALGIIVFIKLNEREAKKMQRVFRVDQTFKIVLLISLGLKLVWGFLARFVKFLNFLVFLADSIMLSFITLGMYFYLEEYKRIYYISNGFFMAIYAVGFALMSLAFIISTFFRNKKMSYNYWVGIILMLVASLITLKLVDEFWMKKPMQIQHFLIALSAMTLWTFYVPLNAYLIVNFRGDRLNSDDAIVSYFEYGIDWFSFFWAQIFLNIKFVKKRLKKRQRAKRRQQKAKNKQQKQVPVANGDTEQKDVEEGIKVQNTQNVQKPAKKKQNNLNSVPDIDDDFMFEAQSSRKKISKVVDDKVETKPQAVANKNSNRENRVEQNVEYSGTNPTDNIQQLY